MQTETATARARPASAKRPEKRSHRRTPRKFEHATFPVDRLVILAGGSKACLAHELGVAETTVAGWCAPTRGGGYLPRGMDEPARLWMQKRGWPCPAGFLTEKRVFADPREG